ASTKRLPNAAGHRRGWPAEGDRVLFRDFIRRSIVAFRFKTSIVGRPDLLRPPPVKTSIVGRPDLLRPPPGGVHQTPANRGRPRASLLWPRGPRSARGHRIAPDRSMPSRRK